MKVHLTFDEPILEAPVPCVVTPTYSDLSPFDVPSYSKREIIAEKLRALLQQQKKWPRPRNLYDLWHILCRSDEKYAWKDLEPLFVEKCRVRGVAPVRADLVSENLREWTRGAWEDRLGPMLNELPDYWISPTSCLGSNSIARHLIPRPPLQQPSARKIFLIDIVVSFY